MKKYLFLLAAGLLLCTIPVQADKMTVTLMVTHRNAPLGGAVVYVNDVMRGTTDRGGQLSFAVPYFHDMPRGTLTFEVRIETFWMSYETTIRVIEGDARTIITIYVPHKK